MKRLAEEFGPDWAMQHIVPQVALIKSSRNLVLNSVLSLLKNAGIDAVFYIETRH